MMMPAMAVDDLYVGEAPRWHDGRLWYSDFFEHSVHARSPGGPDEIMLKIDGQPSGLGWLPDGRLLIVSMLDHRILRQEPDGGITVHADVSAFGRHRSNDMVVDGNGRAYVGNFGFDVEETLRAGRRPVSTSLSCVHPDGSVIEAASGLLFPNGMVLTPDGPR